MIWDQSLEGLEKHHIERLLEFNNRKQTTSQLKELQSSIKFFAQNPDLPDVGMNWKNTYARNIPIAAIHFALKATEGLHNVKIHRICKTAYPLFCLISHNYDHLKPLLDGFHYFKTPKLNNKEYFDPNEVVDNETRIERMANQFAKYYNDRSANIVFVTTLYDYNKRLIIIGANKVGNKLMPIIEIYDISKFEQNRFFPVINFNQLFSKYIS